MISRKISKLTKIPFIGSGHQSPGLWRHPDDQSWKFTDVDHWVELAKLLEQANFHGIFIADVLGKPPSSRSDCPYPTPPLHRAQPNPFMVAALIILPRNIAHLPFCVPNGRILLS